MAAADIKKVIMNGDEMRRALKRISHQILEHIPDTDVLLLVGIKRRGVSIAQEIAENLRSIERVEVPIHVLDITYYRDDLVKKSAQPVVMPAEFDVDGKKVILVDDVLYTGRTARAAMDAIMDMGRPDAIRLAVLVDRGHRELPIRADFVGKNVPTAKDEMICVKVTAYDGEECVEISQAGGGA
ncbi:MAG: bifunctional pyr operon transcriptional regulator/uracil phosphoribosyltransferase PyrR [Christensenellaceae bacterium]|jgi:pyrimidine operon attenuation protein/uracil phosphoribosyltransferase